MNSILSKLNISKKKNQQQNHQTSQIKKKKKKNQKNNRKTLNQKRKPFSRIKDYRLGMYECTRLRTNIGAANVN